MASFRKQKSDLTPEAKQALLFNGMEQCKAHELMPGLIERMFNFELEEEILEREVFCMPDRMPLVFNYTQAAQKKATKKLLK